MLKRSLVYANRKFNRWLSPLHYSFRKPVSLHMSVTHHCGLRCSHCDIWKIKEDRKELTTVQVKLAIKRLRRWLGPFHLNFAGGEPFIRQDMVDIITYAHSLGLTLTVTTSGFYIDGKKAKQLEKAGLTSINISLDSLWGPKHDELRGVPGTYERARKAIDFLNETKVKISIATILMKPNHDEVDKMVDWVEETGLQGINFQPISQNFGAKYNPDWFVGSDMWPDDSDDMVSVVDKLIAMKKARRRIHNPIKQLELFKLYFKNPKKHVDQPCLVGDTNFAVNEYGDILLCFFMKPIGNILKDMPAKIWRSKIAAERRKQIDHCKRNCNLLNCNFS